MTDVFFKNLAFTFLVALTWSGAAYVTGRIVRRHATMDVFWGAGFLWIYVESLAYADQHATAQWHATSATTWRLVTFALVAIWSLRLSIHLALRQRGSAEDSRYVHIMNGARGRNETLYAWKMIYGLQGALMWFISIPLQWIAISQRFNVLSYFGAILVACGIFFEATGDFQLTSFLNDETNKGKTLSTGLWRYTRHPNYFGDAVTWTGFFALAVSAPWGYLTALSPLLMWWLLTSLSGKPMLEKKLSSTREGYKAYIENTSSFIPRRPRRS